MAWIEKPARLLAAVPLVLVAIVGAVAAWTEPAHAEKRFFTILAIEPKGGTTTDKEPFPATALPPGGGYVLTPPNEKTGRWEVSAYVWHPAQIIVNEGDEVTLEFVGINGASHPTTIAAFGKTFTVKRGHAHRVTFKADKAGVFPITCSTHEPSMSGGADRACRSDSRGVGAAEPRRSGRGGGYPGIFPQSLWHPATSISCWVGPLMTRGEDPALRAWT